MSSKIAEIKATQARKCFLFVYFYYFKSPEDEKDDLSKSHESLEKIMANSISGILLIAQSRYYESVLGENHGQFNFRYIFDFHVIRKNILGLYYNQS